MHCDIYQANSIEHIRQAIEEIGVDRIDHGTRLVESPALVAGKKRRAASGSRAAGSNSFVTEDMKSTEMV